MPISIKDQSPAQINRLLQTNPDTVFERPRDSTKSKVDFVVFFPENTEIIGPKTIDPVTNRSGFFFCLPLDEFWPIRWGYFQSLCISSSAELLYLQPYKISLEPEHPTHWADQLREKIDPAQEVATMSPDKSEHFFCGVDASTDDKWYNLTPLKLANSPTT